MFCLKCRYRNLFTIITMLDFHVCICNIYCSDSPSVFLFYLQSWNFRLAKMARKYARQCVFQHSPNRGSKHRKFGSVGENIAATFGTADFKSLMLSWYKERSDYNYSSNTCNSSCEQYKQVSSKIIVKLIIFQ